MATSTIKNSLARTLNWVVFNNTSTLTSQVDALTVGTYDGYISAYSAMSATGMPVNANFYLHIYVSNNANYKEILAYPISASSGECYSRIRKGASWDTEWVKMPTRAEVDALNSNMGGCALTKASVGTTAKTFTLGSNYRGTLFVYDSSPQRNGIYMVFSTGSGGVDVKSISSATDLTVDTSVVSKISLTAVSGTRAVVFLTVQGSVTE